MKLFFGFATYPRKKKSTPELFNNTCLSLFKKIPNDVEIHVKIIGDDYPNIQEELEPIISKYVKNYEIIDINKGNALRNIAKNKTLIWEQACTRSILFGFKYVLNKDYDYFTFFSDDDSYSEDYISSMVEIMKLKNVDLIYSLGRFKKNKILPRKYNKEDMSKNYPQPNDTIATGIAFNCKNNFFIEDNIRNLENMWEKTLSCINSNCRLYPNDALMWKHLAPKFEKKIYSSYLIPKVLVYHDTELTIFEEL